MGDVSAGTVPNESIVRIPSGHPGNLSPQQSRILQQFKDQLGAAGLYDPNNSRHGNNTLLRFLRARNFDLEKTKAMWAHTTKWKEEFGVEELYWSFDYAEKEAVAKYYPRFCHKVDKKGQPVCIESFGSMDVRKLFQVTSPERQLQSLVVEYETLLRDRLPICSDVNGRLIETTCSIIDLQHLKLTTFWNNKAYVGQLLAISQDHYPELVGILFVINAPWAFHAMWRWIKGWLAEETVSKIRILGGDYQQELLEQIPAESLPEYLGGTCKCPGGCGSSDPGPWEGKCKAGSLKSGVATPADGEKVLPVSGGADEA